MDLTSTCMSLTNWRKKEKMKAHQLVIYLILEVIHITSSHFSLVKGTHIAHIKSGYEN